jgi:hypothetical protein
VNYLNNLRLLQSLPSQRFDGAHERWVIVGVGGGRSVIGRCVLRPLAASGVAPCGWLWAYADRCGRWKRRFEIDHHTTRHRGLGKSCSRWGSWCQGGSMQENESAAAAWSLRGRSRGGRGFHRLGGEEETLRR